MKRTVKEETKKPRYSVKRTLKPETRQKISEGLRKAHAKNTAAHISEPDLSSLRKTVVGAEGEQLIGARSVNVAGYMVEPKVERKSRPRFTPENEVEAKLQILLDEDSEFAQFGSVDRNEFVMHPILLHRAMVAEAKLDRELKETQAMLKVTKGEIGVELRKKAAEEGTKITDRATEESVESDDRVIELKWKVMETEHLLDMAKAEVEALKARTHMLVQLGGR